LEPGCHLDIDIHTALGAFDPDSTVLDVLQSKAHTRNGAIPLQGRIPTRAEVAFEDVQKWIAWRIRLQRRRPALVRGNEQR